jgi:regulatory protein
LKITKISEQIKNENRVNIFVDGRYSFSLTLNQLLESKLKINDEVSDSRLSELKKLSQLGKLKMRALEWLMLRPRSQKELRDYLYRKKLDSDEAELWLAEFQKKGYQNDKSFSKWWVEQRRNKKRSSNFIRSELKTKGIHNDLIIEAINESAVDDKLALIDLIKKLKLKTKYQDEKKLLEYLMRQGYGYSLIKEVLAE